METQKIINLLRDSSYEKSKFATKKMVCSRQSKTKRQMQPKKFYKMLDRKY